MPTKTKSPIEAANREDEQVAAGETNPSEAPSQAQSREDQVRLAAYFAAERRGFAPGYEVEDWITAEHEVDAATGGSEGTRPI